MKTNNAMNSEGLLFIWVLEKDRSAYLHVYKSLQKATSALNTFSKIKRGAIDPSIGRAGSRGISQLGHSIGNSKMTVDDIAASVKKKYGVEPKVIRHDVANNPVRQRKGWKIQTGSGNGWSDIKSSYGTDFYKTEYFKTKSDAQSELNQLAGIHGDPESYRIVPAATEEDFDLYNPVHRKNPVRQRIAVSLSRSQSRKNPLLESGATISRNSGINRRAASMT